MTTTTRRRIRPLTRTALLTLAACGAAWNLAAATAPQAARSQATSNAQQLGEVTLRGYDTLQFSQAPQKGAPLNIDARGASLKMTSARYDMAAPRLQIVLRNGFVGSGLATGGVRVEVRSPEQEQTTQVTCESARYTRLSSTGRGRIEMTGGVHSKTYTPQLAKPAVNDAKSATIEFGGGESTDVRFFGGNLTLTPIEPAAPAKK